MNDPKWRVLSVRVSCFARMHDGRLNYNAFYPFFVEGINEHDGKPFCWHVPSVSGPGYDLSGAAIEPDAQTLINARQVVDVSELAEVQS